MFINIIKDYLELDYADMLLVKDYKGILFSTGILHEIEEEGFKIIEYKDVEEFRYIFESKIKTGDFYKILVIATEYIYIPYDVKRFFKVCELDYSKIFPKLNPVVLIDEKALDLDHLSAVYGDIFGDYSSESATKELIRKTIFGNKYLEKYLKAIDSHINELLKKTNDYDDWFQVAYFNARRNIIISKMGYKKDGDTSISNTFQEYIFKHYGKLTGKSTYKSPIIVSKVMDFLLRKNKKTALIVLDGMSISDWILLKKHIDFNTDMDFIYAMIPTITAISRQSLLSGSLPIKLNRPFVLSDEQRQFISKSQKHFGRNISVGYYRGYDVEIDYKDFFVCIIINEIDDLVHRQIHGMDGHIANIERVGREGKINKLVKKLVKSGFEVYITSDHGNKEVVGIGKPKGMGVEVETKSQRMLILKEYASKNTVKDEYELMEYPGYYLPRDYHYLICKNEAGFALKGAKFMSHGGTSIEEVIVPFIKIKGDEND